MSLIVFCKLLSCLVQIELGNFLSLKAKTHFKLLVLFTCHSLIITMYTFSFSRKTRMANLTTVMMSLDLKLKKKVHRNDIQYIFD